MFILLVTYEYFYLFMELFFFSVELIIALCFCFVFFDLITNQTQALCNCLRLSQDVVTHQVSYESPFPQVFQSASYRTSSPYVKSATHFGAGGEGTFPFPFILGILSFVSDPLLSVFPLFIFLDLVEPSISFLEKYGK